MNYWKSRGEVWTAVKPFAAISLLLVVSGFAGAQWQSRLDGAERQALIARFPKVREEAASAARQACQATFAAQITGLTTSNKQYSDDMQSLRALMQTTNELAAYTLRFLGARAKVADQHSAAVLKQTKEATAAAVDAVQKIAPLEQKVNVAVMKSDEAVVTTKALDKKLETATRPALPAKPWIGDHR
jgi:hypothetical protein